MRFKMKQTQYLSIVVCLTNQYPHYNETLTLITIMTDEQEQHNANVATQPHLARQGQQSNLVVPRLPNQVHAKTQAKRYSTIFVDFMEWKKGGDPLPDDYMFTDKEKRLICPDDIHRYFCLTE